MTPRFAMRGSVLVFLALAGATTPARADLIVVGYAESSIRRYADDGTEQAPLVPPGGAGGVVGPAGAVFGPDGFLYVSNQTSVFAPGAPDSIVRIDPATGAVSPFITLASGYVPAGLRFGPDGNLYVSRNGGQSAGPGSGSVDRYDGATGAFLDSVVTKLTQPTGLLFDAAGNLYVSDFGAGNVVTFDGTSANVFATGGGLAGPSGLAFGPDGKLYVADLLEGAVRRYNPDGTFDQDFVAPGGPLSFQFPADLLFEGPDRLLVANLGFTFSFPAGSVAAFDVTTGESLPDFATGITGASQVLFAPPAAAGLGTQVGEAPEPASLLLGGTAAALLAGAGVLRRRAARG